MNYFSCNFGYNFICLQIIILFTVMMIEIFFIFNFYYIHLIIGLFVILPWVVFKNFNKIVISHKGLNVFLFLFYNFFVIFSYFYFHLNLFHFIFVLLFVNHLFFCYIVNKYKISILKLVKRFISLLFYGLFLSIFLSILQLYYPFPILTYVIWSCLFFNTLDLLHILLRFVFYSVKNFIFSCFVFLFIVVFIYIFGFLYFYFDCNIISFDYFYEFSDLISNALYWSFCIETNNYCYRIVNWHASDSIIFDILTFLTYYPLAYIFFLPGTFILTSLYFNRHFIKFLLNSIKKIFRFLF